MRKRARLSYGIYGAGLLIAVIMAFVSNVIWAVLIGVLTVLLNILICARDVKEYRRQFRRVKILETARSLFRQTELAEKNLFPAGQVEEDGMLPGAASRGVVRIGLRGESFRGVKAEIADIAFPIPKVDANGKTGNVILSGCYMRFLLPQDTGMDMAVFHRELSVGRLLGQYYEKQGFCRTKRGDFLFYERECESIAGESREKAADRRPEPWLTEKLLKLDKVSGGRAVVMFRGNRAFVMLCQRFLEPGEPDYKHPVTKDKLKEAYLPELSYVVRMMDDFSAPAGKQAALPKLHHV